MPLKQSLVGQGKVYLIAGGGKIYADIAARFVRSERPVSEIIESPYSPEIIRNIINAGHKAALEFDYFLFGVEGYSRVCETQLVRKRHASYLIKSGRAELGGKRQYSVVLPESMSELRLPVTLPNGVPCRMSAKDLCKMLEDYYDAGRLYGLPEEELRYMKPQATEFRAIIGMNAHALLDFFAVRCCRNAQTEIRDLATKMMKLCKHAAPDIFVNAGPNCAQLGYCPENRMQNKSCKGRIPTKTEALEIIRNVRGHNYDCFDVISD